MHPAWLLWLAVCSATSNANLALVGWLVGLDWTVGDEVGVVGAQEGTFDVGKKVLGNAVGCGNVGDRDAKSNSF